MTNANDFFDTGNGSDNFYRRCIVIYTDGVKDMADTCQAHWLIDLIISHQFKKKIAKHPFQVWKLMRIKDDEFIIRAEDGNDNKITKQHIPFSDFTYDTATLWLVDGTLMFPNEY